MKIRKLTVVVLALFFLWATNASAQTSNLTPYNECKAKCYDNYFHEILNCYEQYAQCHESIFSYNIFTITVQYVTGSHYCDNNLQTCESNANTNYIICKSRC
jgi:hypothetical protein